MPLSPDDFAQLQEMQTLCTALEDDLRQLRKFGKFLSSVDERYRKLGALYQAHWMELSESADLDDNQRQQIQAMVAKGSYSVLDQDTIWNALSDTNQEYLRLLKSLAQKIQ